MASAIFRVFSSFGPYIPTNLIYLTIPEKRFVDHYDKFSDICL